ncbi:MAG TPA: hypothetical protein VGM37_12690 [Armatimonadota bacterium]|jgi:ABC-type nickel/cobalt efflux system permease component RcnA
MKRLICLLALVPAAAFAHPMGNTSINKLARITPAAGTLKLHYVLDLAEIPAFAERQDMDTDGDGENSDAEIQAYLAERAPLWLGGLKAVVDGKPVTWELASKRLEFNPGEADMATIRIEVNATAPLAGSAERLRFADMNFPGRMGYKQVIIDPEPGSAQPAATKDQTNDLRSYPASLRTAPPQVASASATLKKPLPREQAAAALVKPAPKPAPQAAIPAAGADPKSAPAPSPMPAKPAPPVPALAAKPAPPQPERAAPVAPRPAPRVIVDSSSPGPVSSPASRKFHELVTRPVTPGVLAVSLLIALALGAMHAVQPGHGKTLVAAYLVGNHGTARHAALLGITVTISHTFGVMVLGAVALWAQHYILPERLFPWMGFASGVIIAGLGASMLRARLREGNADDHHHHDHDHDHGHDHDHTHDHAHSHDHGHDHSHGALTHSHGPMGDHSHAVPDHISLKSLLALGISGGIVPCWDALIVLLGAIAMHRVLYGMALIVAFSAGLAITLTAAGLAVVWGQSRLGLDRLSAGRIRAISMASHLVIFVLGIIIALSALWTGGVIRRPL